MAHAQHVPKEALSGSSIEKVPVVHLQELERLDDKPAHVRRVRAIEVLEIEPEAAGRANVVPAVREVEATRPENC